MKDKHLFVVYHHTTTGIEDMKICIGEESRDLYIDELLRSDKEAVVQWDEPEIKR